MRALAAVGAVERLRRAIASVGSVRNAAPMSRPADSSTISSQRGRPPAVVAGRAVPGWRWPRAAVGRWVGVATGAGASAVAGADADGRVDAGARVGVDARCGAPDADADGCRAGVVADPGAPGAPGGSGDPDPGDPG